MPGEPGIFESQLVLSELIGDFSYELRTRGTRLPCRRPGAPPILIISTPALAREVRARRRVVVWDSGGIGDYAFGGRGISTEVFLA